MVSVRRGKIRDMSKPKGILRAGLSAFAFLFVFFPASGFAETLEKLLGDLVGSHERVKAAEFDLKSVKNGVDQAKANYLPSLDATGEFGYEHQNKPTGDDDTSTGFSEGTLTATQLLWDFGKTLTEMDRSQLQVLHAELQLENVKQGLIRESAAAYFNLLRAFDTLRYARQSEDNIKRQTGLEEALVERQSGLESDVLQAKVSLAGATSIRVQAEGTLVTAFNRYKAVFGQDVGDLKTYRRPKLRLDLLPTNVEDAVTIALRRNLTIRASFITADIAKKTAEVDWISMYGPEINAVGELNYKRNVAGVIANRFEKIVKLKGSFSIFSGGKDLATYYGSINTEKSARNKAGELRRSVEESVRNSWQNLKTARANAELLRNQANITGEFLELARTERRLGNRSLIDILNSETAFINSISASLAAETDTALAFYNLLFAMSALKEDIFSSNEEKADVDKNPEKIK